jgi:hypothetical protein
MNRAKWTAAGVAMIAVCGGCTIGEAAGGVTTSPAPKESTAQTTQLLRGSVSPEERRLQNARVMAISADRRTYTAPIDAQGNFAVKVPAGQPYQIVIANTTLSATRRAIGHLVVGASRWAMLNPSRPVIELGALRVKSATSPATSTTLGTLDHPSDLQGSGEADPAASGKDGGDGDQGSDHTVEEPNADLCEAQDPKDDSKKDADVELTSDADSESLSAENNQHEGDDQPMKKCGAAEGDGNGDDAGDGQGDGSDPSSDPRTDPDAPPPADPGAPPADPDAAPPPDPTPNPAPDAGI